MEETATLRLLIATTALLLALSSGAQAQLNNFTGYWKGSAVGEVSSGKSENLICTTNNALKDGGLRIILRCANHAGAAVQIFANIIERGGTLSDTWEERTYNVSGKVSGSVNETHLSAHVSSPNFSANVNVRRTGEKLSVSVIPLQGTGRFTVAMSR